MRLTVGRSPECTFIITATTTHQVAQTSLSKCVFAHMFRLRICHFIPWASGTREELLQEPENLHLNKAEPRRLSPQSKYGHVCTVTTKAIGWLSHYLLPTLPFCAGVILLFHAEKKITPSCKLPDHVTGNRTEMRSAFHHYFAAKPDALWLVVKQSDNTCLSVSGFVCVLICFLQKVAFQRSIDGEICVLEGSEKRMHRSTLVSAYCN